MSSKTAEVIGQLAGVSRSSAQKFFKGQPISVGNFQALCKQLDLDWLEIVEEEVAAFVNSRKRVAFVIDGSVDDLDSIKLAKLQAMVRALKNLTGDASITVVDIEEGSIRLILEGSDEGIEKLKQLFDDGELAEVLGTTVTDLESIDKPDVLNTAVEEGADRLKTLLISRIQSQGALGADLSRADLSGTFLMRADLSRTNLSEAFLSVAFLSGADLSGADLSGADLSGAFLSGADLSGADLSGANLSGANLSRANLSEAYLSRADLGRVNLSDAIVESTQFGEGIDLSESEKLDLIRRGAIFQDSPGDRSSVDLPAPVR